MDNERITDLLRGWSRSLTSSVRPGLSSQIKGHIPDKLVPHRIGTINITVDLRGSRIAVAAAILIGLILVGGIVGTRGGILQMYRDGRMLVRYALVGEDAYRSEALGNLMSIRDNLMAQGREVIYYGDRANPKDRMTILMQWKIDDEKYGVILGDLSTQTVSPAMLIRLQARMLQERPK
jgi:hypothetical protein